MRSAVGLLVLSIGVAPLHAQQPAHVVDQMTLARTLDAAHHSHDQDLAAIRDALAQPAVQHSAKGLGLDVARIDAALETVNDRDLAAVAEAARHARAALVGGASTVTISTTTLIIGLLVLILIIVAVK